MKIQIEVMPAKCTGRNLHSGGIISAVKWSEISTQVRSYGVCQCCGEKRLQEELHAHETWEFDKDTMVQKLVNIICVCKKCHASIHYNFRLSNKSFRDRDAFLAKAHYMEVNNCSERDFEKDLNRALGQYRVWNQILGEWSMDISYIIRNKYLIYRDINLDNLEKLAPGSRKFLEPYAIPPLLYFNNIPDECLVDHGNAELKMESAEPCEICGNREKTLYVFYDLRVKNNVPEMVLVEKRTICYLCRETIYFGAHKLFMKHRKTTKHYMKINNCGYKECRRQAKNAKNLIKMNRRTPLFIYLSMPYALKSKQEFDSWKQYIAGKGAKFDSAIKRWYVRPTGNLRDMKDFI